MAERLARLETLAEAHAAANEKRDGQIDLLFKTVRSLAETVKVDARVRKTERAASESQAARDRRLVKSAMGVLSVLWIVAQAIQLFGT